MYVASNAIHYTCIYLFISILLRFCEVGVCCVCVYVNTNICSGYQTRSMTISPDRPPGSSHSRGDKQSQYSPEFHRYDVMFFVFVLFCLIKYGNDKIGLVGIGEKCLHQREVFKSLRMERTYFQLLFDHLL